MTDSSSSDPIAIREWGVIEKVSTGPFLYRDRVVSVRTRHAHDLRTDERRLILCCDRSKDRNQHPSRASALVRYAASRTF